jgi:hypothetical protein
MNPNRQTIDNPSGDTHIDRLRAVPTAGDLEGLRARNQQRAQDAIKALGTRYCCDRVNSPSKSKPKPNWSDPPPRYLRAA